jgi:hypothetical protein
MGKNIESKLALFTSVILGAIALFLMFLCHKLIICIARAFAYLTGLITILLAAGFYIFIIIFIIYSFQKYFYKHNKYRLYKLDNEKMINYIIHTEKYLVFVLLFILSLLYIFNLLIN